MVIKVSIVEDDDRARHAMEEILNGTPGYKCIGVHPNGGDALANLAVDKVDVVLMDLGLPDVPGVECIRELKKRRPSLLLMVLTVNEEPQRILEALQAGASGYLLKRTPPARVLEAISELCAGGSPMTPGVARKVIQHFHNLPKGTERLNDLTHRELEVLHEMAQGSANKEVAEQLKISPETVRNHIRKIFDKLHVRSRTEAVVKYLAKP